MVAEWAAANDTHTAFIDPGSPWQNAWMEFLTGRLRDELLNLWHIDSLLEARVHIEDWRNDYNTRGPHTAHGDRTPAIYANNHRSMIPTQMNQAAQQLDHASGPPHPDGKACTGKSALATLHEEEPNWYGCSRHTRTGWHWLV